MKLYWVYMVRCTDGSFYVGITNDLEFRVGQHNFGVDRDCYTFTRRPVELVYSVEFHWVDEAVAWEKHLKRWSRAKKLALIDSDWAAISRLARGRPSAASLRRALRVTRR